VACILAGDQIGMKRELNISWKSVFEFARPCVVVIPVDAPELLLHGGESDLHITLLTVKDVNIDALHRVCSRVAKEASVFSVKLNEIDSFQVDNETKTLHIPVSSPYLHELRSKLIDEITEAGMGYSKKHDFKPHITLAYISTGAPIPAVKEQPAVDATSIEVWNNGVRFPYSF